MPVSKPRKRAARQKTHDQLLKAAARAQQSRADRVKKRLGWVLMPAGVALFVASLLGIRVLPFDTHHFFGQFGGLVLVVTGVIWATK